MISRRNFLKTTAVTVTGGSFSCLAPKSVHPTRRPKILWILADDLGYGDLGCFGNPVAYTPHLDRFAREGVKLTDFYASAPVCSPTRASLLTGRYPQRCGMPGVIETEDETTSLPEEELLISQILQRNQYSTGIIGKWHLGRRETAHPLNRGFDSFFGALHGGIGFFNHDYVGGSSILYRQRQLVTELKENYITDINATEACRFLREHIDRPFFLYLSFFAVHTAMGKTEKGIEAPSRWLDFYRDKNLSEKQKRYYACVSALDEAVGKVLDELNALGLEKDTLVFFASDNGPTPGAGGTAFPLSGTKHQLWQGGVRVPAILKWPGKIPAGKMVSQPVIMMDLFPTTLGAAGLDCPSNRMIDGEDILSMIQGNPPARERTFFWSYVRDTTRISREKAVRRGNWAWLDGELYDLSGDPAEQTNLAAVYPNITRQLESAWNEWIQQFPKEVQRWDNRSILRKGPKVIKPLEY